ncbi:saccharopine dehydrogenase family protein [Carboxylicivirga linearis]|uniref:Saccharopine dehydrogenase NADP-binding domain-containing protein n=1 Tax=Carboxylicivirga linearis TaxID=1628157 RepID=A0ABS5JX68_9BACT|nr:saccharopine dehydrogenase family protein [Carboxylicivirga linearis]MBS2099483.1 saccharopine dehydrogenase NADP-binding domain-containing protein [Carboxylicivirga linearis]
MQHILIIGAGRSAIALINYLETYATDNQWQVTVVDKDISHIHDQVSSETNIIRLDLFDAARLVKEVRNSNVVVSLLPARLHSVVAKVCVDEGKSLFTASYESEEIKKLEPEVKEKGLLFLNETGLDPGIDHMSAMQILDRIKDKGYDLKAFESFTGGLVAPDSDNNPWHYKFSWNPRNVVVAGQGGTAKFIQEGKYKYIPYNRLFRRTELIEIEGYGKFEGYANRDSLKYIERYNLQGIPTIYRGTLRRPGFCRAWNVFVQLGITDDSYEMMLKDGMTYRDFINSFLYYHPSDSVDTKLYHYMHIDQDSDIIEKLDWLEILNDKPIGLKKATPAQVLEKLLTEKWVLQPDEKDMVVMWHKFLYRVDGEEKDTCLTSSLVVEGQNNIRTAMAKTVGLPLAIAVRLYLEGKIKLTGVHIPTIKEIYEPVLKELKEYGVNFQEKIK